MAPRKDLRIYICVYVYVYIYIYICICLFKCTVHTLYLCTYLNLLQSPVIESAHTKSTPDSPAKGCTAVNHYSQTKMADQETGGLVSKSPEMFVTRGKSLGNYVAIFLYPFKHVYVLYCMPMFPYNTCVDITFYTYLLYMYVYCVYICLFPHIYIL